MHFVGYAALNRRSRRDEAERLAQEAAMRELFAGEEIDDGVDAVEQLAAAWHGRPGEFAAARASVFAEPEPDEGPAHLRDLSRVHYHQEHKELAMNEHRAAAATKTDPRRRRARAPRSRLAIIWLITVLGLAAWVGVGPRSGSKAELTVPRSVGAIPSTVVPSRPRTKRIADVVVGDRVMSDNPTNEEDLSLGAEVDPASWRKLVLRAWKKDRSCADVELLRPVSWIEERGIKPGGTARISVPECGIDGDADVLAIEPCPPIMPGRGRVVTGTFHHSSSRVMDLEVEGLSSPIVTTVNHLFWSADRGAFVRADELKRGEHLRGREGPVAVRSATPRRETIPVYNLEVHIDHTYHVSAAGILVHNSNCKS